MLRTQGPSQTPSRGALGEQGRPRDHWTLNLMASDLVNFAICGASTCWSYGRLGLMLAPVGQRRAGGAVPARADAARPTEHAGLQAASGPAGESGDECHVLASSVSWGVLRLIFTSSYKT